MMNARIDPAIVHDQLQREPSPRLLDVRPSMQFESVHAVGAENIPFERLTPERDGPANDSPLYLICHKGVRSQQAVEKFHAAGFEHVASVEGGIDAWMSAGLPVQHGKPKAISLERQVRITAGSLVVLGIALAWFTPWALALSAFVGAGLAIAGITDTCAMGMLMAKMPWNR